MCLSFLICCKHGYNVKWNFVRDLISIASCAAWMQDHNNTFVFAILYQKNALLNPTLYTMTNTYNNVIKSTKFKRANGKLHDRHKSGVQKKKRHQRATLWPLNRITTYYYIRRFFSSDWTSVTLCEFTELFNNSYILYGIIYLLSFCSIFNLQIKCCISFKIPCAASLVSCNINCWKRSICPKYW